MTLSRKPGDHHWIISRQGMKSLRDEALSYRDVEQDRRKRKVRMQPLHATCLRLSFSRFAAAWGGLGYENAATRLHLQA